VTDFNHAIPARLPAESECGAVTDGILGRVYVCTRQAGHVWHSAPQPGPPGTPPVRWSDGAQRATQAALDAVGAALGLVGGAQLDHICQAAYKIRRRADAADQVGEAAQAMLDAVGRLVVIAPRQGGRNAYSDAYDRLQSTLDRANDLEGTP
jgi:hypothetical protein